MVRQHPDYRDEIVIEVDVDSRPVLLEGDEDLLHRVVSNLVLNSVQAAEPGVQTTVRVEARNSRLEQTPVGLDLPRPVLLRVSDDGPGINQDDLERIFDPFFSGRPGGTGLGLAIVHRAVEAHHGSVFVESEPGRGTRFSIYLPGDSPAAEPATGGGQA
jgi:two-component system sensor histidine kinase PilS (NtrC family)